MSRHAWNQLLVQPIRNQRFLRTAKPRRAAVDETAVKITGEWSWLSAAINVEARLTLDVALFKRHGTDPAATFLHSLTEKHNLSAAVFLVDLRLPDFRLSINIERVG